MIKLFKLLFNLIPLAFITYKGEKIPLKRKISFSGYQTYCYFDDFHLCASISFKSFFQFLFNKEIKNVNIFIKINGKYLIKSNYDLVIHTSSDDITYYSDIDSSIDVLNIVSKEHLNEMAITHQDYDFESKNFGLCVSIKENTTIDHYFLKTALGQIDYLGAFLIEDNHLYKPINSNIDDADNGVNYHSEKVMSLLSSMFNNHYHTDYFYSSNTTSNRYVFFHSIGFKERAMNVFSAYIKIDNSEKKSHLIFSNASVTFRKKTYSIIEIPYINLEKIENLHEYYRELVIFYRIKNIIKVADYQMYLELDISDSDFTVLTDREKLSLIQMMYI